MRRLRAWWHRRTHVHCGMCGTEFRKGHGGGMSRSTICSDACWNAAWRDFLIPRRTTPTDTSPSDGAREDHP